MAALQIGSPICRPKPSANSSPTRPTKNHANTENTTASPTSSPVSRAAGLPATFAPHNLVLRLAFVHSHAKSDYSRTSTKCARKSNYSRTYARTGGGMGHMLTSPLSEIVGAPTIASIHATTRHCRAEMLQPPSRLLVFGRANDQDRTVSVPHDRFGDTAKQQPPHALVSAGSKENKVRMPARSGVDDALADVAIFDRGVHRKAFRAQSLRVFID